MITNILLTGLPKSGKSTLLSSLVTSLDHAVGMSVLEVLDNANNRTGFTIETHTGTKRLFASTNITSNKKMFDTYYVHLDALAEAMKECTLFSQSDILYLDEIGQMQLELPEFESFAATYLDAPNICIATVSRIFSNEFTTAVKNRSDVLLIELTPENRTVETERAHIALQKNGERKTICTRTRTICET